VAAEPEVVEEKTHFDIELSSFDKATKIKVIKEIRGIMGLGLKEAKDLVESAPQWITKDMKKEDAEEIVAKLKAVGAECKLV
jgi:large subunit ribosomal protein L7/L12